MSLWGKISAVFRKRSAVEAQASQVQARTALTPEAEVQTLPPTYPEVPPPTAEIERDSYYLGLAAGYTGKAIKDLESSVVRIESQMATKDWVTIKLQEQAQFIENQFEDIKRILRVPKEPSEQIRPSRKLPLSSRMEKVLLAVKDAREISYEDLALKLGIGISDLRSLLSIMANRTDFIERFKIGRCGWVRYKSEEASEAL